MQFNKVDTLEQAQDLIRIMPEVVAIDTEYVKGDPRTTKLLLVIIADSERAWAVVPSLLPVLTPTIQSRRCIFLQDYNHCDTMILLKNGCDLRGTNTHNLIDMHHLIDENSEHSLDARVKEKWNDNYKEEFWSKYKNFEEASEEGQLEYACKDGIYTYRLGIRDIETVPKALYTNVRRLSSSLLETEINGIKVNVPLMVQTKESMNKEIQEYLPKLRENFKEHCEVWEFKTWAEEISKRKSDSGKLRVPRPTFNFDSDKQVSWLVYEALKLPVINKTKNGNPSTNSETLQALSEGQPALQELVRYKDTKSIYSTFVEGMLERVQDGRIYPNFNVSGTSTGRISHSNPNMGNLPTTGIIRNFFIPDSGMCLIGADYSQLEVIIEANLTSDPNLIKIITEGVSKHDITAQGLSISRDQAKTLNFALQYGAGSGKVAKILGISKQEAEDVFNRYWKLYSGVKSLKEQVNKEIEEKGQITNAVGRVRHFPKTHNKFEVYKQQRQAYNFLIQGVAAECCNRAFIKAAEKLKELGGKAVFSVHDEIICQVPEGLHSPAKEILVYCMESISEEFNFKYPLTAVAYGPLKCWSKA